MPTLPPITCWWPVSPLHFVQVQNEPTVQHGSGLTVKATGCHPARRQLPSAARFFFRYCTGPKITCGVFRGALQKWNKKCHCLSSSEPQHHSVFYYFSSDILSPLESTWLRQRNKRMGKNPFAKVTSWETDDLLHTCVLNLWVYKPYRMQKLEWLSVNESLCVQL